MGEVLACLTWNVTEEEAALQVTWNVYREVLIRVTWNGMEEVRV